ncbi:hypothetical protein EPN90_04635 [Patescibacteria group bacterium]|nr:MAG: hypothetical protein EPN90_04635 [Patescibacteria group bacterium]
MFGNRPTNQNWKPLITGVLIGALLVLLAIWLNARWGGPRPDPGAYQAVFLSNNQVYFGKLKGIGTRSPVLEDVFYLQMNQPLQQGAAAPKNATGTTSESQPKFSLSKLGQTEIHLPLDRLYLSASQIVFWENLKKESQVVRAILDYQRQNLK